VVAVAVEAGDPQNPASNAILIERSAAAFRRWTGLIADRLVTSGVTKKRADELAMLMTTALEGAIIVARSTRDIAPIDVVHRHLRALIQEAQR
jgi:hypothetical protein